MQKHLHIVIVSLLAFTIQAQGQSGSVSGQVFTNEEPLAFASVGLEGTRYGTTTDAQGIFEIKNV
ncbi:MAG: carboxypeptidase-like regulatory domain-containing protein, partial [Bacteroidota bacterium]